MTITVVDTFSGTSATISDLQDGDVILWLQRADYIASYADEFVLTVDEGAAVVAMDNYDNIPIGDPYSVQLKFVAKKLTLVSGGSHDLDFTATAHMTDATLEHGYVLRGVLSKGEASDTYLGVSTAEPGSWPWECDPANYAGGVQYGLIAGSGTLPVAGTTIHSELGYTIINTGVEPDPITFNNPSGVDGHVFLMLFGEGGEPTPDPEERVTQMGVLVEVSPEAIGGGSSGSSARVTQFGVLVEVESTSGRYVVPYVGISWDGTNPSDETPYLISASGETRLTPPGASIVGGKGIVDRMTLVFHNRNDAVTGRRFSPLNEDGPLYDYIKNGGSFHKPVVLDISLNGEDFQRVFTGVIKIPQESVPTPNSAGTVTIECRSVDEELLQLKMSTDAAAFKTQIDNGYNEAVVVVEILEGLAVGLTSSDYSLDPGLFSIPYVWLDDESVLDELWQLAAACGGRFYADRDGLLRYENMQHWLLHALGETLDRSDYAELKLRYDDANLFSQATVEASPRRLGASIVLWEPDELIQVPAGGTRTITARLKQPAYTISAITYQAHTSGGANITSDVTLTPTPTYYAQRIDITFANANTTYAATINAMQITGIPVLGAATVEEAATSTNAFWTSRVARSRSVRGNLYVQSRAQARALAEFVKDTQELPKLDYVMSNVLGDPARELGDYITINDDLVMSAARGAYITAISWTLGIQGYKQTITAIDAANVFKYGPTDYFKIGTDTLNGGKRVFY
jgi:hypothetical protein